MSSKPTRPRKAAPRSRRGDDTSRNFRQLVDASEDVMLVVDAAGQVLFANAAAGRLFGRERVRPGEPLPVPDGLTAPEVVTVTTPAGESRQFERGISAVEWDGKAASLVALHDISGLKELEGHLRRVNRLYAALGQTAASVSRAENETELFEDVSRIAVAFGGFQLALVALRVRGEDRVACVAAAGPSIDYLETMRIPLDPSDPGGQAPIARTLRLGVPYVCNDIASDPSMEPFRARAAAHGLQSLAACPIRAGGTVTGALAVYATERNFFESDLLTLLNQLAAEISIGLDRLAGRAARRRAESALLESETRFRQMAGANRQVFWMRAADTHELLYVSPAFATVYGRPVDELEANPGLWLEAVHPEDRAKVAAGFGPQAGKTPATRRYRIERPDGEIRWVEEETFPIFEGGRLARLTGTVTDVTERQQAEEQMQLFRRLIEYSGDAFFIIRPQPAFRLVFLNEAGARHFGRPREAMLGLSLWEWDPQFPPDACVGLWELLKRQHSTVFETVHQRADGSRVKVEVAANYLRHGADELIAGYFHDISARAQAEAALRENEEKFRTVFEQAGEALFIAVLSNGGIIDCNQRALEMFGAAEKADLVGRAPQSLSVRPWTEQDVATMQREIAQAGRFAREMELVTVRGHRFWGAVVGGSITLGGRELLLLSVSDITERRRLIELLSDTQRLARIGGWELRIAEDRLVCTEEVYRIFGLPPDAPITWREALALLPPAAREELRALADAAMKDGQPRRLETSLVTAQGLTTRVRLEGRVESEDGRPWRLYGTIQDVTQEVAAAQALREREERLREQAMLLDAANDAIVLRGLDDRVQYWNHGAERLFGWAREEALGKTTAELYFHDRHRLAEVERTVLDHGTWSAELEHITRDGRRILAEQRWTLIGDAQGQPKAFLIIISDVTEKKRIEAGLMRAQRLESIGTLAGGIAHDLNNILAPIILSADMLRSRLAEAADLDLVEMISASARRGADVVRQVLSFARGAESTRVPINLRYLLPEFRKMVAETFPRNIRCEIDVSRDLWTVQADPTQVHQVLLNLALNARDAMPDGGVIRIEAANVDIDATFAAMAPPARPGPHVRVRVLDTGSGIPPGIRERIFDPFFTTREVGQGSGLGLSTVLAIMRGHGGFLTAESEVGRGSTFTLFFPAEAATIPGSSGPAHADLPRGSGESILVIDDEQTVRSITSQGLESAGYRVLLAADGAEGVKLFEEHRPEIALVLTDVMMPVMDGFAAIKALRRMAPGIPIVAMSGVADGSRPAEPAAPAGTVGFLLKPFTLDTLLTTVHAALDRHGGRSSGGQTPA